MKCVFLEACHMTLRTVNEFTNTNKMIIKNLMEIKETHNHSYIEQVPHVVDLRSLDSDDGDGVI